MCFQFGTYTIAPIFRYFHLLLIYFPFLQVAMGVCHAVLRFQTLLCYFTSTRNTALLFTLVFLCYSTQTASAGLIRKECRKVGAEELIDEEGCDLMIVRVNRCSGHCLSFTFPNPITGKMSIHAKCCRMIDTEWVNAELTCLSGPRPIKIPSALQCECFDCAVH